MTRDRSARRWIPLAAVLAVCVAMLVPAVASAATINGVTLPDAYGRDRSLGEFADKDILVVAFFGAECPLARLYGPRLQELADEYGAKGVAFVGIDSNNQDSLTDMLHFGQNYGVKFPLLKDRDGSVADQVGAVRNPEVFVFDKNRELRYRGRIDDQYGLGVSSGYAKPVLRERNLGSALDEMLAGKPVSVAKTDVTGCIIGRVAKTEPKGEITYSKNIAALLDARCAECHRDGQIGPFALTDYESAAGWAAMMKEVVSDGRMPPWSADPQYGHFGNDPRLTDDERSMLFAWIDNGCPQGNLAETPKGKERVAGWRISKPDQIVSMTESFHVPAEGVINYKNYLLDPGWTEDKWVQECEVQPGAWANVHHIVVSLSTGQRNARRGAEAEEVTDDMSAEDQARILQARERRQRSTAGSADRREPTGDPNAAVVRSTEGLDLAAIRGGRLGAYIPGRNPTVYSKGTAIFCPAGSKISLSMHYTANGKEAEDISRVGLVFADPKDVKWLAHTATASNGTFVIPPHAGNHKVEGETLFAKDSHLIVLHPHMHLRGKAMKYEAFYPNGTSEILLDVPKYDFNWQFEYELAQPKLMPAGTRMHVTAYFDNSEANVANPDPTKEIKNGPQSWDEMMIGYYTTITPLEQALAAKAKADAAKAAAPGGEGQ